MRVRGSNGNRNGIGNRNGNGNGNHNGTPTPNTRHSPAMIQIGSRTKLILSPDGRSVQLAPEAPKSLTFSPTKALVADSTSTSPIFRQDVREEWIGALFGPSFLQGGSPSSPASHAKGASRIKIGRAHV